MILGYISQGFGERYRFEVMLNPVFIDFLEDLLLSFRKTNLRQHFDDTICFLGKCWKCPEKGKE